MYRFVAIALLFVGVGLGQPAAAQTAADLPARPVPFTFVTDQGKLLSAADAKKLDGGLRSYAEKTGTQVVVVTVPSLGGRSVADYGRALGTAWGVGQRDKNNGVVVLLSAQEHKVTIQPGSGLASVITPAVTSRIIGEMTPSFKQGNYFAGLRSGLNTLLVTANPSSNPRKETAGATAASTAAAVPATTSANLSDNSAAPVANDPVGAQQSEVSAPSSAGGGIGMGTLLIGALVIGGILFFILKMFRNRSAAAQNGGSPNFYPNQGGNRPNQNPNQPNFYPNQGGNQGPGNFGGGGYNQGNNNGGGSGMGGILATGAAAAAGAYIGNRMSSHGDNDSAQHLSNNGGNSDTSSLGAGAGAAGAAGTGAAGDYFSSRGGNESASNDSPDYFSGNDSASDSSGDYFSSDNSSYDDTSSDDTGGGGFDDTNDNSGSW